MKSTAKVRVFHDQAMAVSYFQHINLFDFMDGNKGYRAKLLMVLEKDEVIATLMALQIKQGPTCCPLLNERFLITGSPVILDKKNRQDVFSLLINEITKIAKRNAVFIEFRPHIPDPSFRSIIIENKYQHTDHLNLLVDLNNRQILWDALHESKKRQVKKSLKNGLIVAPCSSEKELAGFFEIIRNLYTKQVKKPYPAYSFFLNFYHELQLKDKGVILLAKWQGQVLGGMLCPYMKGQTIYEWYIAGLDKENVKNGIYPSVMLTWSAIEYGLDHGFKTFDFMGAGKPTVPYGVRDFKKRFGGELVNAGRYIYVNKPLIYKSLGWYFRIKNSFVMFSK
ncbi:MAG: peptidoglycan bridge formation glycyltransferase FemA/FemB family protein [Bacteroidales bacterium]|nr:peptidoglycan bridge formation glycyltransferase FemA/FemB family protein [Bacteroidales bacterium]MCF8458484.1 peptidoglycan bridge formation glycyltransferase FemA/FemB family protein [Bacteroidales bacterium]